MTTAPDYPTVALGKILKRVERIEVRDDHEEYPFAGTYSFARGVFVGEVKLGSTFKLPKIQRLREADFVYSKIMAWEGAFGLVPAEAHNCVMSGAFVAYEPDKTQVEPKYLAHYFKAPHVWRSIGAQSTGTNIRRRSLHPKLFEAARIPLPSLPEQQRIVARIEEFAARIEEARGLRSLTGDEVKALNSQLYSRVWTTAEKEHALSPLDSFANVIDPQPDHRTPPAMAGGMPYVSIANISQSGEVDVSAARQVSLTVIQRQRASFIVDTGDIVLGKIGTIGAARPLIVNEQFALSANVVLVQPHRHKILDKLLLALLRAPQTIDQFSAGTRKTAQTAFGIKKMRKLLIPVPTLVEQHRIVEYLEDLQTKVNLLKRLQAETAAELDALLPSVLDRAFGGKL